MSASSYKLKWIAKFERDRDYFAQDTEHFKDWDRRCAPDNEAWIQFITAETVLFGNGKELAEKFLRAAIEVVDRGLAEDKFRAANIVEMAFPRNRGEALRVRAYARALKTGSFDASDLLSAGHDIEEYCRELHPSDWDSQPQAQLLGVARMALIAGDLVRAREVLGTKRSLKWHAEEHRLLKDLVQEALFGTPIRNEDLLSRIMRFFDRIRDPDFKPDVFMELDESRLEWGAIINKYFETGGDIDWNRVIDLVSR